MVTQLMRLFNMGMKRICTIALIVLGAGTIGFYTFYYYSLYSIQAKKTAEVKGVGENRAVRVLGFIERQLKYSKTVAYGKPVIDALKNYDDSNKDEKLFDKLKAYLEEVGTAESYRASMLISRNGRVIYSNFSTEYNGLNLLNGSIQSALSHAVIKAHMTVTHVISSYLYDPILKKPCVFIVIPVFENSVIVGYLAQLLNEHILYDIFNDYLMLGTSAEIAFGIASKDGALIINHSRELDLPGFKQFISTDELNESKQDLLLLNAVNFEKGEMVFSANDKKKLCSWRYIPRVNWGMVVIESLNDFTDPYNVFFYVATLLLMIFILFLIYKLWENGTFLRWYQKVSLFMNTGKNQLNVQRAVIIVMGLLFGAYWYQFTLEKNGKINKFIQNSQQVTTLTQEKIQKLTEKVEQVAKVLSHDLSNGLLKYEDLIPRLKRDLKDNEEIYGITVAFNPYKYKQDIRLYAPYVMRGKNDFHIEHYENVYDYTKEGGTVDFGGAWYIEPMKLKKPRWLEPYWEEFSDKPVFLTSYSLIFYSPEDTQKTSPIGVINVAIDFELFKKEVQHITLGNTGYSILFSSSGALLSFPQQKYVDANQTIIDIARMENDNELYEVVQNILEGKTGFYTYNKSSIMDAKRWLYAVKVPSPQWFLCTIFSGSEVSLSALMIRHYAIAFLILIMVLLFTVKWRYSTQFFKNNNFLNFSIGLLAIGFVLLILIVRFTPEFKLTKDSVIVSDQTHINKYVQTQQEYAQNINEPVPQPLYFGMYITSIKFPNSTAMDLSGYLWQKVTDSNQKDILREIEFLQAVQKTTFTKLYERTDTDGIIVCWRFFAKLSRVVNNAQYPFDPINLSIRFEHRDYAKNIILVPLIGNYTEWQSKIAGLSNTIDLSGFQIQEGFFTFNLLQKPMKFEFKSADSPYGVQTSYEISMIRDLLYDFIVFMLPLLIIYFLLYTVMVVTEETNKTKELFTLSVYTSLIFVAILLHRALRSQYQTGGILYLESLFFLLYISFIIIVLYTSLNFEKPSKIQQFVTRLFFIFKNYFWPIQLIAFFIITLITFYFF